MRKTLIIVLSLVFCNSILYANTLKIQDLNEKKVILEVIAKTLYLNLSDKTLSKAFIQTDTFFLKKSTTNKNEFLINIIEKALKSCNKKKSRIVESKCVISVIKYKEPKDPTKNQKLVVKKGIDINNIQLSWDGLEGKTTKWISLLSSQNNTNKTQVVNIDTATKTKKNKAEEENKKLLEELEKLKKEKFESQKIAEIEINKAEEENKKLLEELEKLKKEKLESQKLAKNKKNEAEEKKIYNELNLLYGPKCKKSFFNNLYEVGTPEYKTCILNKGPQKQKKAKQLAAKKKAEEKKESEELNLKKLAKKKQKLSKVPNFYNGNCGKFDKYKLDGILKSGFVAIERFKYKSNFKIGEFRFCNIRTDKSGHTLTFTKVAYNKNNIGNGQYISFSRLGKCNTILILDRFYSDTFLLIYQNTRKNTIGTTKEFAYENC